MREVNEGKEVKEKSGGIAAFFDLDGTLVPLPSLEQRLFRMLRYRTAIPLKNYLLWLREAFRLAPRGYRAMSQANKMYLRGLAAGRWEEAVLAFSRRSGQAPAFFCEAIERLSWHAEQSHAIVLVSGTLESLAQEAARAMEGELAARGIAIAIRVRATRLERAAGKWTGGILGEAMFGNAKAHAVERLAGKMQLDLARCFAYGDSVNDLELLATVGRPVAVNPERGLEQAARKLGWPILHWASENKAIAQRNSSAEFRASREHGKVEKPVSAKS